MAGGRAATGAGPVDAAVAPDGCIYISDDMSWNDLQAELHRVAATATATATATTTTADTIRGAVYQELLSLHVLLRRQLVEIRDVVQLEFRRRRDGYRCNRNSHLRTKREIPGDACNDATG
jgi:hypothetical protein